MEELEHEVVARCVQIVDAQPIHEPLAVFGTRQALELGRPLARAAARGDGLVVADAAGRHAGRLHRIEDLQRALVVGGLAYLGGQ